ncbi:MAG: Chorismate synthase [Chlamydiales bacterium]|nr:Chorismate synthase [Chlamydiales bacterium]
MGSNTFGQIFQITTWGESHGRAIGVVIDGCPSGIEISEEEINLELAKRAPGKHPLTSPRKESDRAELLSGVFEGVTTGAPISILIPNRDVDSSKYESIKHLVRPGHANYTYTKKYGVFDYRGGGRASARETACRVAAGAVAKKFLAHYKIHPKAILSEVGGKQDYMQYLEQMKLAGDSLGGVIEVTVPHLPEGLGEPVYLKMEAMLAQAMLSLPASKGFEMGVGFRAARMRGSEHNDLYVTARKTKTNHAGGTLGGLTNGMPLVFRVAFKPTSSIAKSQQTITLDGKQAEFQLPEGSRHDPCVAIRAVSVVEAMTALVLADTILLDRCCTLPY